MLVKRGISLKIAFDVQLLMKGEKTGIAWCTENILKRMPNYQHNIQLNCFTLGYSDTQFVNISKYRMLGYTIKQCIWFHDVLFKYISCIIPLPYSLFFPDKADITMFFNYIIPPGVHGKRITIIYDMAYKACPETVRNRTKNMLNLTLKNTCKRADKIITISEFSKGEIIQYMGVDEDKIVVMPCGVDFSLYHPNYTHEQINNVKRKYKINDDYLLYLGTLEPRKNIPKLIQAYAELKKKLVDIPKLVLAGRKGWMYDSIFKTVTDFKLEDSIIFTGYVSSEDTPILISGAKIFLFPSLYEGFGMPPLEAMACKVPVVVSNRTSLPEVVGDAGILVDPLSVDSISEGIKSLLINNELRTTLALKGYERSKTFSWDNSLMIIEKVIQEFTNN